MARYPNKRNNNDYGDSYNYSQKNPQYEDIYSGKSKKKMKTSKKIINIIIIILCIIFAISGSFLIYAYNSLSSLNYDDEANNSDMNGFGEVDDIELDFSGNKLLSDPMVLNVLLFGSDSYSAGDGGRTDSMLMVSVDNRHKKLKFTSFLRDSYVQIPGYGEDRLNAAYALGGPALTVKTIEGNFGIDVDRYIVADFPGFEAIINRMGGIDMELTADECAFINSECAKVPEDTSKDLPLVDGTYHLTGLQALSHARNRDSAMSDFDRTSRQRDVMSVVVSQMKTASLPTVIGMISDVGPMLTTNLKKNEIATLAANSLTYLNYPIEEYSIPNIDEGNFEDIITQDGAWVLGILDMEEARYELAKFIFEDSIKTNSSSVSYDQ